MTSAPEPDPQVLSVLGRAMGLLAEFAGAPAGELTLTDLSRRSGLPLTTVHRLTGQLVREGALERLPGGRYRVGLRLWELGMLAPRAHGLREVALPYLEDLYEVTHQNVQLIVLDGTESVVVERLRARNAVRLVSRAGGRLPIHATSGGIALLAHADPDLIARVLEGGFERFTDHTIAGEQQLRAALAAARTRGWVELRDHLTIGGISIAAPVLGRGGRAIAAVSVVGNDAEDPRPLVPALLTTTRAIARALGA